MSMELESAVEEVKAMYPGAGSVNLDNLPNTFLEEYNRIKNSIDLLYKNNPSGKIILFFEREGYYDNSKIGTKLRAVQTILNELNIDNSSIIIVTPNPNIDQEVDEVSKYSSGTGKFIVKKVNNGCFTVVSLMPPTVPIVP